MPAASNDDSTDSGGGDGRHTPFIGQPASAPDARKGFELKLRRAAASIRKEAQGRICGGCQHWSRQGCDHTMAPLDGSSAAHPETAVACGLWEALPSPLPHSSTPPHLRSVYRREPSESTKK